MVVVESLSAFLAAAFASSFAKQAGDNVSSPLKVRGMSDAGNW